MRNGKASNTFVFVITDEDRAQAKKLFDEGWLPTSNKYQMVGLAPTTIDYPKALARLYGRPEDEERYRRQERAMLGSGMKEGLRDHYARMSGSSKTLKSGVYAALKQLCGPYNRGPEKKRAR